MSRLTISNGIISVGVNQKGAELASIRSGNQEYLWEADPKYWGRHSAILFPIVGKLKNDQFHIDGKTYKMSQHGFARDMVFDVVNHSESELLLTLKSNKETLSQYPYQFDLQIHYAIDSDALAITYTVINTDNQTIYFSIGGHPAFKCPLREDEKRSDYYLLFNEVEDASRQLINDKGLRTGEEKKVMNGDNRIRITDHLFDEDALIFKHLNANKVTLVNGNHEKVLTFQFTRFPYLGIWSKSQASSFICIEPWYGVADAIKASGNFLEKEGILMLDKNKEFSCTHEVRIW